MIQLNANARDAAHATGAHAATDLSGFGLAGHAVEMAGSSGVTLVFELGRLPLLPGAYELVKSGNKTRASTTNRQFAEPLSRIDADLDRTLLEFAFDPQTSGGLLIAVPADRAEETVRLAREGGAEATFIVGHVVEKEDVDLVLRA